MDFVSGASHSARNIRSALRVRQFSPAGVSLLSEELPRRVSGRGACVRVTHSSVGSTDVTASLGHYLLHPLPGFITGYDFVGTIEQLPDEKAFGLHVGQRVAGVLPRMGAHAEFVHVAPSLLVPVPPALDSATAATIPLDAVTAKFSLNFLKVTSGAVLIQGAGGSLGSWAAQMATSLGLTVYGTASPRSRCQAEQFSDVVFDYRDAKWIGEVLDSAPDGVDGAMDHTGSRSIRRAVSSTGRIVRTAFGASPSNFRTASGFLSAALLYSARPRERVCSAPFLVATQRSKYRRILATIYSEVAQGKLTPPSPCVFPAGDHRRAFTSVRETRPGTKVVIEF